MHGSKRNATIFDVQNLSQLKVKIFADGAEKAAMIVLAKNPLIKGFTTNPTLMRKAGVVDYEKFAKEVLTVITDKPISFEVFSDDFTEMKRQAELISSWGANVFVKIPMTNTQGDSSVSLIKQLVAEGIKVNVTAILTLQQIKKIAPVLSPEISSIVSVFAGRVADTGVDPVPIMREAKMILSSNKRSELLWASTREVLNIVQAEEAGCHIITVTNDLLKKLDKWGTPLEHISLETVQMFYDDGKQAGHRL